METLWKIARRAIPPSYAIKTAYVGGCVAFGAHRVRLDSSRRQNQNSRRNVCSSTYVSSRGPSSGGWPSTGPTAARPWSG